MIKDILSPHRVLLGDHTELRAQRNASRGVSMLGGNLVGNTRAEKSGVNARVYKNGKLLKKYKNQSNVVEIKARNTQRRA